MMIPYRTRRLLHRFGMILLAVLVLIVLFVLCWSAWVERYIVYTRDGVVFDFDLDYQISDGVLALPPSADDTAVSIYFNEGDNALELSTELTQLKGYYVSADELLNNISGVTTTVRELEDGTAVMLEVKNGKGVSYYDSQLSDAVVAEVDVSAVSQLITLITRGNYYAIARVSAFQDYYYGLNNVEEGLPYAGGSGYLWMDDEGCYWLKPSSTAVMNRLIAIVEELKGLGFDEVVFTDFCFPNTEKVTYKGDKAEALATAMDTLITNCNTSSFCVSFSVTDYTLAVPDGRSRLYLEKISAQSVAQVAATVNITDGDIRLVFMAETNDTRFDDYGVLRPISSAAELENK